MQLCHRLPDHLDRRALIFGVTALRHLCAVEREATLELLRMTIAEIQAVDNDHRAQEDGR